jgi:L-threonylcarbamoyladenylate synthase
MVVAGGVWNRMSKKETFYEKAVWGLGGDPLNEQACLVLLQIKRRPIQKGMILIAGSIDEFADIFSALPVDQVHKLDVAWQNQGSTGAITFLVPDSLDQVPYWIKGSHNSFALREFSNVRQSFR